MYQQASRPSPENFREKLNVLSRVSDDNAKPGIHCTSNNASSVCRNLDTPNRERRKNKKGSTEHRALLPPQREPHSSRICMHVYIYTVV